MALVHSKLLKENPNDQYQCLFIAVYQELFILLIITHNLV